MQVPRIRTHTGDRGGPNPEPDAPALSLFVSEFGRASAEVGLFLAASRPLLQTLPRGDGHPVLLLPGLLSGDLPLRPLCLLLRRLGYRAHGWQLGRNLGPTAAAMTGMPARIDALANRYGRPVSLVGWSLGGVYARRMARRCPDQVRQVVTLGSPIRIARPGQTRVTGAFEFLSRWHVEHAAYPLEHDELPLAVPATSIYSRMDGVVSWQASLDLPGPRAENIAVLSSHLGFGFNPAVIWAIADRLAQPEGQWSPFEAPAMLRPLFPPPDEPAILATAADPVTGTAAA